MDAEFWQEKWHKGEIGFHLEQVHPLLKRFLPDLNLAAGQRVLVPLCGKSLDLGYLLDQGLQVVGVELSDRAVDALFEQRGVAPECSDWAGGKRYQHGPLTVFQGDFFALDADSLGRIDAIYDRAALIALPEAMRNRYAAQLVSLSNAAPQLLITLSYDQQRMDGPPFSVDLALITALYQDHYNIAVVSNEDIIKHEPRFAENGLEALHQLCSLLTPQN
ncbi:thiopurine S-methyltransferase [Alcanivorax sediminis]|uniref:Thiopurine S-methyltransferase n=1 Tax=Alcanivorax sediminis TaxID=2663008 RepID=A0A6N7LPQ8_9GAMM|nr:thiopurine S-methyltransferase [Alcanivorax sediminis]MQX52013.1 thiopurine S-methyltransferase [Alcanivorax sediminis]